MPGEIVGVQTTREPDGLAMSSRNRYLSAEERAIAPAIYGELERARKAIESGASDFAELARQGAQALRQAGFRPDYFEIRDAATLEEPSAQSRELVVLTAARIGRARLIDNVRAKKEPG
jgi:pantoate--beta-alanine ligase